MEISNRLKIIASLVQKGSTVADIGTDHGYIPIYLAVNNIVKKAYAMDVKIGPLNKAKMNIEKYMVKDRVETLLSNGLQELKNDKVDTIIIAGMGGMLVSQILEEGKKKLEYIDKLVLAPHLDVDIVRRKIHDLGYQITEEMITEESGKYYNIINCKKGKEIYLNEIDYLFGKKLIDKKDPLLKEYLSIQKKKNELLVTKLTAKASDSTQKRIIELKNRNELLNEVIKCL